MKNMEARINGLAKEVVIDLKSTCDFLQVVATKELLDSSLYSVMSGNSFENEYTYNKVYNFVISEIKKIDINLYEYIYPAMQMDQNGNYTTNSNLWV